MPIPNETTRQPFQPRPGHNGHQGDPEHFDLFEQLRQHFRDLKDPVVRLALVQLDRLKLRVREFGLTVALAVLGLVAAVVVLGTAVVFVMRGVVDGLALLLGGHTWAAELIVGSVILTAVVAGTWFGIRRWTAISKRRTIERYEKMGKCGPINTNR